MSTEKTGTAHDFLFARSAAMPQDSVKIKGFGFNKNWKYSELMASYKTTGYQASNLYKSIEIINEMLEWRLSHEEILEDETEEYKDLETRKNYKCKIFLGYTSNLVSCGLREMLKFIVETNQVDVLVSSAGGVEEDFIKCLGDTFLGAFDLDGSALRKQGLNRIGNLIVPNDNYCKFETWLFPILDQLLIEQKRDGIIWTPSKIIHRLGKEINHQDSIYYWAYKHNIPVFCPALTDGSLGDMIYFHGIKNPGLIVDIAGDIRLINDQAGMDNINLVFAKKTGMIILGGGVIKHHICNANLMRNGADFAVYVNTGQEFDGSDAGARPDEAISWGKIRGGAKHVKVYADATLVFPLIVAETFASSDRRQSGQTS